MLKAGVSARGQGPTSGPIAVLGAAPHGPSSWGLGFPCATLVYRRYSGFCLGNVGEDVLKICEVFFVYVLGRVRDEDSLKDF